MMTRMLALAAFAAALAAPAAQAADAAAAQALMKKSACMKCHSVSAEKEGPSFVGVAHRTRAPELPIERVHALAAQFAEAIPERELSMASLQGFLMTHKTRPFGAVEEIGAWVEKELAERRRLESG